MKQVFIAGVGLGRVRQLRLPVPWNRDVLHPGAWRPAGMAKS